MLSPPHELAVLVPVLNRPQNVKPLVESFLKCGAPGVLVFIGSPTDIDEWMAVQNATSHKRVECISTLDAVTWPEKQNLGVQEVDAEWYLLAADDVTFEPGWWDTTKGLRQHPSGPSVIGTNDLANPRCISGEHSTHTLVRGDYVKEHGTIDEPGKVVHDGYAHWYVDDELKYTAMYRGVWAHCTDAHIAHHHPYFDKAIPWDDTYAQGEANAEQDRKLFCERAPMFGVACG